MSKSKRKQPTPHGQHRDRYASKPRAEAPVAVETKTASDDPTDTYQCLHCGYVGTLAGIDHHSEHKKHWQRVRIDTPAPVDSVPDLPRGTFYRCVGCGYIGRGPHMTRHLRNNLGTEKHSEYVVDR